LTRLLVGHSGDFEVDVPLAGRVLFGSLEARAQAAVNWTGPRPVVTAGLQGKLSNAAADALGLASPGGHVPLLQDQVDADFQFRADRLPLDRRILAGRLRGDLLDRLAVRFSLRNSAERGEAPGVLQLSSAVRVRRLNKVLDRIVRGLQMRVPPQTVSYRDLSLVFSAAGGQIRREAPLLTLGGVRLLSAREVQLNADVRVHLGREEDLRLRDLLYLLESIGEGLP
jgi:hypothetical protein